MNGYEEYYLRHYLREYARDIVNEAIRNGNYVKRGYASKHGTDFVLKDEVLNPFIDEFVEDFERLQKNELSEKNTYMRQVNTENRFITTKICMTKDVGVNGHLFGGNMMAWIDEAGATFACQICSDPRMVTVKVDEMVFKRPVKVGQHIKFYGSVIKIGKSSIEVKIEVYSHNLRTGDQNKVCETNVTFVRIDEEGQTVPISKDVKDRYSEFVVENKNDNNNG